MDNKPVQGVPIRADTSSKEEKYARIKQNSAPPSATRSSIEISPDFMKMNEGKKPSDFTMRRSSGQTKIYKAVVDIDIDVGETSAEKVSPVSSTRSNEHVVAHVEPHTPKPNGYSDKLHVPTSTRSSHPTGGGSMDESPGIHANGAVSPSSSSIVSSQAQHESQYAGMTGYIDLANSLGLQRLSGYTVSVRFLSVTESDIWNRLPVKFVVFQRRLVAYVIIVIEP